MADLHDAAESGKRLLVDLFASEHVRIVEEIAEEPAELPKSFSGAINPPRNHPPSKLVWFEDGESQDVEGLRRMPAVLGSVDADQENAIGHLVGGVSGVSCGTFLLFARQVAVELAEQRIAVLLRPIGQVQDEILDLLAGSLAEGFYAAKVGGVGLHQSGIKLVLANNLTQPIADSRSAVVVR